LGLGSVSCKTRESRIIRRATHGMRKDEADERLNRGQNSGDVIDRTPLILQNIQTNSAICINWRKQKSKKRFENKNTTQMRKKEQAKATRRREGKGNHWDGRFWLRR
jgi:hypothetical protein